MDDELWNNTAITIKWGPSYDPAFAAPLMAGDRTFMLPVPGLDASPIIIWTEDDKEITAFNISGDPGMPSILAELYDKGGGHYDVRFTEVPGPPNQA